MGEMISGLTRGGTTWTPEFVTDINGIVFLDNFRRDWLEGA